MALPFLPGNSFNKNLGKTKYHKSHHFDISNDVSMLVGEAKPGIGGERLPFQKLPPPNSYVPRGQGTDLPSWVAFDKQVLSFDAFYQEPVHEKREEQYRVHSCKIYFYLEDDSIQVVEPRAKNAGLPQGTIIRRHRIARPPPCDDTFYTVEDFNIGKELVFYGKTFKITDLDPFTRNFLTKLGVRLQNPSSVPNDPYMTHRKALDESMQPLRPYEKMDTLKQFIDHDRHVLRFYCYWDDKENMFGDSRYLVLHYFLADDTIEILERVPANSGRDAVPMFLRRGRLPKIVASMLKPGEKTDRTVLNVFGPMQQGGRYILDSLKTGEVHQEYYKDSDLSIGAILNVWGRKVVLCDCDEFTREYYKTKFGVTEMSPIAYREGGKAPRAKEVPPYNGFGSEEDSLCSCQGLMPSPPRRDFIKFMEKQAEEVSSKHHPGPSFQHAYRFGCPNTPNVSFTHSETFEYPIYAQNTTIQRSRSALTAAARAEMRGTWQRGNCAMSGTNHATQNPRGSSGYCGSNYTAPRYFDEQFRPPSVPNYIYNGWLRNREFEIF